MPHINDTAKYNLAKNFTELAIQNNLFVACEKPEDTANEICIFFDTVLNNINAQRE